MIKNETIHAMVSVTLSDHSAKIAEIIKNNLAPGKLREEISKFHHNDIARRSRS